MKEVICAWKRMEEERADLEGWMAGTEEELKKMERSPTEEVKELTGQVNRIGVSPIHQNDAYLLHTETSLLISSYYEIHHTECTLA